MGSPTVSWKQSSSSTEFRQVVAPSKFFERRRKACALLELVGANAASQAHLARAPAAVMLPYAGSPAFQARALLALVGANAASQAHLARAAAASSQNLCATLV